MSYGSTLSGERVKTKVFEKNLSPIKHRTGRICTERGCTLPAEYRAHAKNYLPAYFEKEAG